MFGHISRANIRKLLDRSIKTDAELDAFCLDYFPGVQSQFGTGFSRIQKINLLLEKEDPPCIYRQLSILTAGTSEISPHSYSTRWLWFVAACILVTSASIAILLRPLLLPSKNSQIKPQQELNRATQSPTINASEDAGRGQSEFANSEFPPVEFRNVPAVASSLHNLAGVLEAQGKYKDAEAVLRQVLAIQKRAYGIDHPSCAQSLESLASLMARIDQLQQAVQLQTSAISILEKSYGPEHPIVASSLSKLAGYLLRLANYDQAEPVIRRAIHIREISLGSAHSAIIPLLTNLQELYRLQGKFLLADQLQQKIKKIEIE